MYWIRLGRYNKNYSSLPMSKKAPNRNILLSFIEYVRLNNKVTFKNIPNIFIPNPNKSKEFKEDVLRSLSFLSSKTIKNALYEQRNFPFFYAASAVFLLLLLHTISFHSFKSKFSSILFYNPFELVSFLYLFIFFFFKSIDVYLG